MAFLLLRSGSRLSSCRALLSLPLLLACGASDVTGANTGTATSGTSGTGTSSASGSGNGSGSGGSGTGGAGSGGASSSQSSTGAGGKTPSYTIDETVADWQEPSLKASLHFAPLDGMEKHVLAEVARAKKSLRLAFFNIRLPEVKTLLEQKTKAGIDVHVLLDKKQQDLPYNTMYKDLTAVGVKTTLIENSSASDATMHDKFTIVDGLRVLTGSANYSYTALNVSDEDLLTVEDAGLAARFQAEFDELVAKGNDKSKPYNGEKIQAWMGPEDGLSGKIVSALDDAKATAVVAMFDIQTKAIIDAVIAAKKRGVTVVMVVDKVQADTSSVDETIEAEGIPVIRADNQGGMQAEMHSKFLVVDHQRLLMGSYNWTNLGSFYNDENLMTIDNALLSARAEGKLADLLTAYKAPAASKLGLTTGKQTVTFKVGNVKLDPGLTLRIRGNSGGPFDPPKELKDGAISLTIDAGTRVPYGYEIVDGATKLAVEQGGKSLPHSFTVPYAPGPFQVFDIFKK